MPVETVDRLARRPGALKRPGYRPRSTLSSTTCWPSPGDSRDRLYEAMRHAAIGGGKRLRPLLTIAAARLFAIDPERALRAGCAIEAIHVYSLIHDDLPCMDDADLRRGKPTVHKAFGEADSGACRRQPSCAGVRNPRRSRDPRRPVGARRPAARAGPRGRAGGHGRRADDGPGRRGRRRSTSTPSPGCSSSRPAR